MKGAILFLVLWILWMVLPSPAAEVENVNARQEGNRMLLEYDLVGDEPEAEVVLRITIQGREYTMEKLHLEGDFGKVKPGKGKKIYWNVLRDFPRGYGGEVEWELVAEAKAFKDPVTGMEFVFVEGGCFEMGDTFGDGELEERPVHEVCLRSFYMGKYEVSQGQWRAIMGRNPSHFKKCGDDCPVESVSWNDIQEFISKLNQRSGKKYRLSTEAEWEYAARSGGKREKWAGTSRESELSDYAWYAVNSAGRTHPIGKKRPNGLGIYDMSGNVGEWCADWYDENYYKRSPRDNPVPPAGGLSRVIRGGSWLVEAKKLRCACRDSHGPEFRSYNLGFRLVWPSR